MRYIPYFILIAAAAGCDNQPEATQPLESAQQTAAPRFEIAKISAALGGTVSRGTSINSHGLVAGFSNLPGNLTRHAALWRDGFIVDLGTLGGAGCSNAGAVAGIAETADLDPLSEEWSCTAFLPTVTGHICRGFMWEGGVMTPLPTFGGNQGFATGINSLGQIVGWAETPIQDPTCHTPQVLPFRAAMWQPKAGTMQELPPFPGDSTSAATAINQRGQAVGISGECDLAVGRFSARHALLWENGNVTDIGNLGGTSWHTPMAINEQGDVVGFSNPPGDPNGEFLVHAFLWTRQGGMRDLGRLPGDATSQALSINSRRQVVGLSTSPTGVNRAFLWQDGVMMKLNDLAGARFADSLVSAQAINDAGQITGRVFDKSTGRTMVFVATTKQSKP